MKLPLQRVLYAIMFVMLLCLLASCDKRNPTGPTDLSIDPFSNGGTERNMIVVLSDFHLGADLSYAECHANLAALEKLLEQIRVSPNVREVVIAGDLLDEWFVPATTNTYQGQGQLGFVQRVAIANHGVIEAINRIIAAGDIVVTYLPGNHDLTITAANVASILPGINQARDDVLGLGSYTPAGQPGIVIEHGHRYNFFCAPDPISNQANAPGSILPVGYFFTRIAALHVAQNCHTSADTLPIVTQNTAGDASQQAAFIYWNIWKWAINLLPIQNMFDEPIIVTNINGFTDTYSVNDLLPFQSTPGGFIDMHLFRGIQDTWDERQILNHVAVNIPTDWAIENTNIPIATDQQAITQYSMNPNSNKRIVVFGHTHDAKMTSSTTLNGQKAIYANSGTWIDHNAVGSTMDFVVITPQSADSTSQTRVKLYNYVGEVVTKKVEDSVRL